MPELAELIRQRNFNGLKEILCGFPAPDIAEIFVDLKPDDEAVLLRLLPRELAAEVFEYLPLRTRKNYCRLSAASRLRRSSTTSRRTTARRCSKNFPPPSRKNCSRC